MRIDKSIRDDFCILSLKGEFDTFYVPSLQSEIEGLLESGISHVILNMRMVKFINSTALGAIIKAQKLCKTAGGELLLAHPSSFVNDVVHKVGIDQIVPVFEAEEEAIRHVIKALNALEMAGAVPMNQESILVSFPDAERQKTISGDSFSLSGKPRTLVGSICNVNGERVQFVWSGTKLGMSAEEAKTLFFVGGDVELKFQVKMFKKGYFELVGNVTDVDPTDESTVRVTATFADIADADRQALTQFAEDMAFLKRQLPS
ncbi:MAG: STAS domain-containing protein [Planctomycetota bacterium]|nr:STAS domain-containing protein [Planctomycetota bacterium]